MKECIKKIYEHIYGYYSGNRNFELVLNEQNSKYLDSFIHIFERVYLGSIDEEYILNYIVFQLRFYEDKNTRLGKGKVYVNWVFGKKAIDRWLNKPEKWLYFNEQFLKRYNIPPAQENEEIQKEKREFYKKQERKRFFGTEMGLIHCSQLELFDKFSKECLICKYKKICEI